MRCGLYNKRGDLQPLRSVDVNCTVRQDFACQVNLTQVFFIPGNETASVSVSDTDGDIIEFRKLASGVIQYYVNNKLESRDVSNFGLDCNSGEYVDDQEGKGTIPAMERLKFARKVSWLFELANKPHCLTIENAPGGRLKPLGRDETPKHLVETSYYFPIDGNAGVYSFRATLEDGTVVAGIVQEKKQARETYEKAKKQGKTAFLMEQEKSDIFQISLGNVYAGEAVKIDISYVAELEMRDGRIRLRIPNRIAPKCGGGPSTTVDYPIKFDFAIQTSTKIGKIEALGGVDLRTEQVPGDEKSARVTASREGFMNEDLVLMISQECPYGVYTTLERSIQLKSECLRLTFNNPVSTDMDLDGNCEIIFLVDKSGSMRGDRMKTTKFALTLFLRSLPENSKYNIVAFDRSWNLCFQKSSKYNDKSIEIGQAYIDRLIASGGTNINGPLGAVLSKEADTEYPRTIIILTDGEVNDTQRCIETARRGGCRIFTIGVGSSFSQELVQGIAEASKGSWLAVHNTEDMGNVVMQTLGNALKPVISKCKADLGPFGKAEMWPSKFPQIMDGVRTTMYWVRPVQGDGDMLPGKFTITLNGNYNNGDDFEKKLNVITGDFEGITESQVSRSKQEVDSLVHRVAAMARIKRLEKSRQSKKQKNQIRDMGLKYNLASSETSFVAVRNNENDEKDVILRETTPRMLGGHRGGSRQQFGRMKKKKMSRTRGAAPVYRSMSAAPVYHSLSHQRDAVQLESSSNRSASRATTAAAESAMIPQQFCSRSISKPMATGVNLLDSIRSGKSLKKAEKRALPLKRGSSGGGPMKGRGKMSLQDQLKMKLGKRKTGSHSVEAKKGKSAPRVFRSGPVKQSAASAPPVFGSGPVKQNEVSAPQMFSGLPMQNEVDEMFSPPIALSSKESSGLSAPSMAVLQSDASTPETPLDTKTPGPDNFLSNLFVGASSSAADQQQSSIEFVAEDDEDWAVLMEGGAEEEVMAAVGGKVPLNFNWLLAQQSASGMFKFSPNDPRFLDYHSKNISATVSQLLKNQDTLNGVLATLYALAALTLEFADRNQEWQFMFAKGKRWVAKQLTNKRDFDVLFALLSSS